MTVAGGKLQGSVPGVRVWNLCSSPENHRPIQASYKLEVHGGEGCKAGAFPPYIAPALAAYVVY